MHFIFTQILIFSCFFYTQGVAATWLLKAQYGKDSAVYSSSNSDTRLAITKGKRTFEVDISKENLKKIELDKSVLLSVIGYIDWKVDKYSVKKEQAGKIRTYAQSSYFTRKGRKMYSIERNFYNQVKRLHFIFTNSNKKTLFKDSRLSNIRKLRVQHGM